MREQYKRNAARKAAGHVFKVGVRVRVPDIDHVVVITQQNQNSWNVSDAPLAKKRGGGRGEKTYRTSQLTWADDDDDDDDMDD